MKKLFASLLVFCWSFTVCANAETLARHGALYVKNADYAQVEKLFESHNFTDFGKRELKIPRIYLNTLPSDWQKIEKSDEKNKMFIRIMLPLIMKVNEKINLERNSVLNLWKKVSEGQSLTEKEQEFVEQKAQKYDVFTRNQTDARHKILLDELIIKIDELPPSFLLAIAGVYSDWGNSRLAIEANSLYREEIWYSNEGIAPEGVKNADFTYRKFDSLEDCLRSYIHKINTEITYQFVWAARSQMRKLGTKVVGQQIITAMAYEGKLKNMAGMLDFNLSYYKLNKTDMYPSLENVK